MAIEYKIEKKHLSKKIESIARLLDEIGVTMINNKLERVIKEKTKVVVSYYTRGNTKKDNTKEIIFYRYVTLPNNKKNKEIYKLNALNKLFPL